MKAKAIVLTLVLSFVGVAAGVAENAHMGTWKLNEAKSKLGAGTPKNNTVVYQAVGDKVQVTIDGIDQDGKPTHNERGKFDGKDYPVIGVRIQMRGRTQRSMTIRWGSMSKKGVRSPQVVASLCLLTGRVVRSPPAEPIRRARSSRVLRCTTSSSMVTDGLTTTALPVWGSNKWDICLGKKKINFSTVFAGQAVGIREVHDDIWLVSFMDYDLGYFDLETRVLEPLENPFGPKVLPM